VKAEALLLRATFLVLQGCGEKARLDLDALLAMTDGDLHDQADANWIVIRGMLWGHNDMPCGRPTPAGLSATWGLATLWAYLVFSVGIYY
jgi:hypothetical protein